MSSAQKMKKSETTKKISKVGKTVKNKNPTYENMIQEAIKNLPRSSKGCSRPAIQSYITKNFQPTGSLARTNFQISHTLKKMTEMKKLILVSGVGAAGRFKLLSAEKVKTPKKSAV